MTKLITDSYLDEFTRKINKYLEDGWKIISPITTPTMWSQSYIALLEKDNE